MSLYQTYNKAIMEAIRQLTLEEMLCALHDVAYALNQDRIRDLGPGRATGHDVSLRPGWISLRPVEHAMLSAGFEMPGVQKHEDLAEAFGEELASELSYNQDKVETYMRRIGSIMEEYECGMPAAIYIEKGRAAEEEEFEIPDDLEGFGWS